MIGVALLLALSASAVRRPTYGGVLRAAVVDPLQTLDPARAVTFSEWLAVGLIHGGLYRLDDSGDPIPDMVAKRCSGTRRGKRWRCTLRQDVRFHDGRIARAADVRHSVSRAGGAGWRWATRFVTVEVIDDFTVRLITTRRLSERELGLLLATPALSVVREGAASVGVGPFRVRAAWQPEDDELRLVSHAEHHFGRPYLDGVRIRPSGTEPLAIQAYHYGKADLVFVDSPRYADARRIAGPVRETVGLLVRDRPATRSTKRRARVSSVAPRGRLAERISGTTSVAGRLIPHVDAPKSAALTAGGQAPDFRWFIGAPEPLLPVAQSLAAALGPAGRSWAVQPLDRFTWRRALDGGPGRWDAVLTSWQHATAWPAAALQSLSSLCGVTPGADPARALNARLSWIPLVDRARVAVHTKRWRGIRWTATGALHLADAWKP